MTHSIKVRLNQPMLGKPKGAVVTLDTDHEGTPLHPDWRSRLKDAETDGALSLVNTEKEEADDDLPA